MSHGSLEIKLEDTWVIIKERLEPVLGPRKFIGGTIREERLLAFLHQKFHNFQVKSSKPLSPRCI